MNTKQRWYTVDGHTARLFIIGEWLEEGSLLGVSCFGGQPVLVEESGQLAEIQYDIWQDRLFLALSSKVVHTECRKSENNVALMIY